MFISGNNSRDTAAYGVPGTGRQALNWCIFTVYTVLLLIGLAHHELWGDEFHSWNLARGSAHYSDLIRNIRFEGHPPLWYSLLWVLSRFTDNPLWMQPLQGLIIVLVLYLYLFRSSFPPLAKLLLPFGYYFLFEYAVFSRNYAIALLFAFCLCLLLKERKPSQLLYYVLLFLLSSCHLVALVLAGSIHLYFLMRHWQQHRQRGTLFRHIVIGGLVFLPAVYFIFPPSDSETNISFFMQHWSMQQLKNILIAPLKSLLPFPAPTQYHFWNTHFMLEGQQGLLKLLLNGLVSLSLVVCVFLSLKGHRKSRVLFGANLLVTFLVALVFPLNSSRYVGFIFIGFIVGSWLAIQELPEKKKTSLSPLFYLLLCLQLPGSVIALSKDFRFPFSNAFKTKELEAKVPIGAKLVTDSWTLNAVSAFTGRSFYCVDYRQEASFILWDRNKSKPLDPAHPYSSGLHYYFERHADSVLYLLSQNGPETLSSMDNSMQADFALRVLDREEGALEPYSNLYLYQITNPRYGKQ